MKRIMIITAITAGFCANAQKDTDEIEELLNNERYQSAEVLLEEKISKEGADPNLNYLLVKTYLEQRKTGDARKVVELYHLDAPGEAADPLNRIAYGRYLLNTGQQEKAFALFGEVLDKKNKKNPILLMAIAEVHIQAAKGDAGQAIALLDLAEKKDKRNPEIDLLKGCAYRKMGDASNAYLYFQSALKKDPANVKAHYQLGKIFTTQKNSEVYLDHFMKAHRADSTYAPVLEALYDHYYFRDVKKAKKFLEKYIANSDYAVKNEYSMTDILYLNREYNKAIDAAQRLLDKEKENAQPRLFKLMAYSYDGLGDSVRALQNLEAYFAKENPAKIIAADYDFRAKLTGKTAGDDLKIAEYYAKAYELDTLNANKAKYATEIAGLYKKLKDYSNQAKWLEAVNKVKERKSNVDIFNWGLAHYNAQEYVQADTVFGKYIAEYPDNIYGYYWRAQVNAAIDTSLAEGLAVPHYLRMIEIGEKDKEANKKMLAKAYGYLGGYEANTQKNYPASLAWFEKLLEADPENADAKRYIEILKGWMAEGKTDK